ncbi:MAG: PIN domain-containing protein [Leptolyngbyaceae cyanobacterium bins.349]|nr:PIN domain-containing protein [Leptolyngbyaceae cyanobacterium bins.349]
MKRIFVDTFCWVALANKQDEWHQKARTLYVAQSDATLVTTDEVLTEFLNYFAEAGSYSRQGSYWRVQSILRNESIQVIPQSRESFLAGLKLYSERIDKGYSLTDCISMQTMRQLGINEVLTHDKHFTQEGFVVLLTD